MLNQHNGKRYIGYTTRGLRHRRNKHLGALKRNQHHNRHLQAAWNQGDRYLLWVILEVCSTIEEVKSAENKWIAYYDTTDDRNGYNLTHGGDGPDIMLTETREMIGRAHKGKYVSLETRRKQSESRTGTKLSLDTRKKISMSLIGNKVSLETRHKISKSQKGRKVSLETRNKLSQSHMGHKVSVETRKRQSYAQKMRRERERLSNPVESH